MPTEASNQPQWLLPDAVWQVIADQLNQEDLLTARLTCSSWRRDLGACVLHATAQPMQLLAAHLNPPNRALGTNSSSCFDNNTSKQCCPADCTTTESAATLPWSNAETDPTPLGGTAALLKAFPHCQRLNVMVNSANDQANAHLVINSLAAAIDGSQQQFASGAESCGVDILASINNSSGSSSDSCQILSCDAGAALNSSDATCVIRSSSSNSLDNCSQCTGLPRTDTAAAAAAAAAAGPLQQRQLEQGGPVLSCKTLRSLDLCLNAVSRSFRCKAQQDAPSGSASAAEALFGSLSRLSRQLTLVGLNIIKVVLLDMFPADAEAWRVFAGYPALRELVLPPFKPALPHEHLPGIASIIQLKSLTLSVQGSFTAWRSNCAAFASLSRLTRLCELNLHAFHCPGGSLAEAVLNLAQLTALRLSGRVVLEPLLGLTRLATLQTLELTQDVQHSVLCELTEALPKLQKLAVGRVTLPLVQNISTIPAAAPHQAYPPAAVGNEPNAAAAAGHHQAAAALVAAPPPHPAPEAAAVVVAANNGGPGAAAAAAAAAAAGGGVAEGGLGEVMLEDVGAIVDGLIGNLQEGAVPVHLQRIIERFESIIQLDLTRRVASSPWGWPSLGVDLLQELGVNYQAGLGSQQQQHGWQHGWQQQVQEGRCSDARGCSSVELALLKPSDVIRLGELPLQLRDCCQHLGLRLRDQLLAFAGVCPVRLSSTHLAGLGLLFNKLQSLSLSGKVAIDGPTLLNLTEGFASRTAGCMQGLPRPALSIPRQLSGLNTDVRQGLSALSLDCHFVGVSGEYLTAALQQLTHLQVLCIRHRGAGKLPVPIGALPASLNTLAAKKVLLYVDQRLAQQLQRGEAIKQQGLGQYSSTLSTGSSSPDQSSSASSNHTGTATNGQDSSLSSTSNSSRSLNGPPPLTPNALGPAGVDCHAITSPGFRRAAETGTISAAPSSADLEGMAARNSSSSRCSSCTAADNREWGIAAGVQTHNTATLLPSLQRLYLKNCLASLHAMQQLLGVHSLVCDGSKLQGHSCSANSSSYTAKNGITSGAAGSNGQDDAGQYLQTSSSSSSGNAPCGVAAAATTAAASPAPVPLRVLAVSGDTAVPGDAGDGWQAWIAAIGQLKMLQVLDLAVPDSLNCCLPHDLLTVLVPVNPTEAELNPNSGQLHPIGAQLRPHQPYLPRLTHLHLTTSHTPHLLVQLTALKGLRTLSINYTGPPELPTGLVGQLQEGLGPSCKVQLWEQVVMQHHDCFGGLASGAAAGGIGANNAGDNDVAAAEGDPVQGHIGGNGCRSRRRGCRHSSVGACVGAAFGWAATAVGGYCFGWWLGGLLTGQQLLPATSRRRRSRGRLSCCDTGRGQCCHCRCVQ